MLLLPQIYIKIPGAFFTGIEKETILQFIQMQKDPKQPKQS